MKKTILILASIITYLTCFSQKDSIKVNYEKVKQQCTALPLSKKATISVTRFNVTTTTSTSQDAQKQNNANENNKLKAIAGIFGGGQKNAEKADAIPTTLGDNMATMLKSALQGVNCFRVLESLKNNEDLTQEIDGTKNYSGKKTPKSHKQLGAQIVVSGEITAYSEKAKGANIMGVIGSSKKSVKMSFNLTMTNPETRDVIDSKNFTVETGTDKSTSVLGISTSESDPAVAAVLELAVIKAVERMSHVKDSLNITADNIPGNASKDPNAEKELEITLTNANFSAFNSFANILSSIPKYKSMEKSLSSGVGTYTIIHTGTADAFLDELNKKLGTKYEVIGFENGKIDIKVK